MLQRKVFSGKVERLRLHFLKGSTTEPVQQVFLFLQAGEVLAERELLDTVRRKRLKKATSIWEE